MSYDSTLRVMERHHILKALNETGWKITQTARLLGIGRATLYRKIKEYALVRV